MSNNGLKNKKELINSKVGIIDVMSNLVRC